MSDSSSGKGNAIHWRASVISAEQVEAFRRATRSDHSVSFPPSFATLLRRSEFDWLERLHIDMHNLLHTEQEYEFHLPFRLGETPEISTLLADSRQRAGMQFITLGSEMRASGELKVVARSSFVVRQGGKQGEP